ncbi:MAG: hypothetical protein QM702_21405 [Rubrivivax sp.]
MRRLALALLVACARTPAPPEDLGPELVVDPPPAPRDHRLAPGFQRADINHVLSTGQSLSVGALGTPPLSRSQPFANLMFGSGVVAVAYATLAPLVEGGSPDVETMSSGFANHVAGVSRADSLLASPHDLLVSVHGMGSTPYTGLKRGSPPYQRGLDQVAAGRDRTRELGKSYVVRAVTVVHGESDHYGGNTRYADDLLEWQRSYDEDVRSLTKQATPIPMFETQVSTLGDSRIPLAQLDAHVRAPGLVVLVGPKYHLPYADGLHLTAEGYRHMGEDYAKAYRRVVLEGRAWEPLRPRAIARRGDTLMVSFHVPEPPLVLDTTLVSDPGSFGFEWLDGAGHPSPIVAVDVVSATNVRIRLSSSGPGRLRYAIRTERTRGNLRDSDATPSRHGYALYNWCVHFDEAVP